MQVTGLDLDIIERDGIDPQIAMQRFAAWITESVGREVEPIFVGFNAPFDWSFINFYFHRYYGSNPFGHSALDIKAVFMGHTGCDWAETSSRKMASQLGVRATGDHNALHDALFQAELFRETLARVSQNLR
jgi:hypothetical protein